MSMSNAEIFLTAHLNALSPAIRAASQSVLAELKETKEKIAMLEGKNSANLSGEVWRDVVGFEGLYKVSNKGRVKSLHHGKEKIRKLHTIFNHGGYAYLDVCLNRNGKESRFLVHRLVALAFIHNPKNKPFVNHLDGNPLNNCVENLAWATQSENGKHAYDTGLHKTKFTPEQVKWIRENFKSGDYEFGASAMGRKFGVSPSTICRMIHGETY